MTKRKAGGAVLRLAAALAPLLVALSAFDAETASAASAKQINSEATAALNTLYRTTQGAKALGDKAVGVLIFPSIVKGGFIVAGQFGDGVLRRRGKTVGYYRSLAASYGFQAAQAFGCAVLHGQGVARPHRQERYWEIGSGPTSWC
jgi:lipid-binding SYLF domain-containing protein